jgi:inorganic pyrophosphatase
MRQPLSTRSPGTRSEPPPWLEVVIEIPRWSFLKRGSNGRIDFVSPVPCPYNYGSVPGLLGLEGDLLDALVLGPRLRRGARVRVAAHGAVGLLDRGLYDDKLVCSVAPPSAAERQRIQLFFLVYGWAKRLLNWIRMQPGATRSQGWHSATEALARARPVRSGQRREPIVRF